MLNYNLLLEDLLNQSDVSALEEAIANQFSPAVIQEKLRITGKYERLPLLLPFFKLAANDYVYVELATDLLAEICREHSAERKSVLYTHLKDMNARYGFSHAKTAFLCGKKALPLTCLDYIYNEEYADDKEKQYVGGVLATDNLDHFLQLPPAMQLYCDTEMYWGARKIMTHFMSDEVHCSRYCKDAIRYKDIEDVHFLLAYPNTRAHLVRHFCKKPLCYRQELFVTSILSKGLITLTEDEFAQMKEGNEPLYHYLTVDV